MSATVKFSDKPCFTCKSVEKTFKVKMKDGTFDGVLCLEHLHEELADRWIEEEKEKAAKELVKLEKQVEAAGPIQKKSSVEKAG
jgi:hypothetical protein